MTVEMIVLLSGPTSAGKTTLGTLLRDTFGVPLVSRDDIKDHLYPLATAGAPIGAVAGAARSVWGEVLRLVVDAGRSVIADPVASHESDWRRVPEILDALGARDIIEVRLTAPAAVLIERFKKRNDPPYVGHLVAAVDDSIARHDQLGRLYPSAALVEFDTSVPSFSYDAVVQELESRGLRP